MKKISCLLLAAFSLAVVFSSCSNGTSDGGQATPLNYEYLTANRCYIGGSLIWNPSGKGGQLSAGTKIGVRIGKLNKIEETVYAANGSQTEYEVSGDVNSNTWATLIGGTPVTKIRYEDDSSKAVYGFITINSIGPDSVNLTYVQVDKNDRKTTKSFTIKKGDSVDLTGSGIKDLKYDEPAIKRSGYENARWLTFLNENTTAENAMYFTFSDKEVQAGYRAIYGDDSSVADDGLYGVNSNNDFIFIASDKNTNFDFAYGDYIVRMPDAYDEPNFEDIKEIPDDDVYYDVWGSGATENTQVDLSFGGDAYVAVSNTSLTSSDHFKNFEISYEYPDWQFPDPENGPLALFSDLSENSDVKALLGDKPESASGVISKLNEVLTNSDFFNAVVDAKSNCLTHEEKVSCKSVWGTASDDDTKKKYCRVLIDELYDESPDAVIEAPELGTIYPTMVLNLGSVEEVDTTINEVQHTYIEELYTEDRKINSTYKEFEANRKKIRAEWDKFRHIDLTSVVLLFSSSGNTKVNPKDAGFNLGLGIKLTASNPSGRIKVESGSAICLDLDLSLKSLNAGVDVMTSKAIGNQMEKLLKKFFKSPKCEVKMADVQIAGPLPFVVGAAIKVGFNIDLGNWNPHIGFCGLYGADTYIDVEYGVDWFCKPYIRGKAGGRALYPTEIYVGLEDSSAKETTIKFEPWFQIIPSFGLGYTVASVRGAIPVKVGTEFAFKVKPSGTSFDSFGINFGVNFSAYAEADIKIAKLKYTVAEPKLLDGQLRLYPTPVRFIPK